ncbi:MAG: DNA-processing protein DprA [Usitatibacter sp.]
MGREVSDAARFAVDGGSSREVSISLTLISRDEAGTIEWLRFAHCPGVGYRAQRKLLDAFGSPRTVLEAHRGDLARFVDADVVDALVRSPREVGVDAALRWLARPNRRLLALGDADYPQALASIHDPPWVLYVEGRAELLRRPALAIVGSRNATPQGLRDSEAFAKSLSDAGLVIVSGLALGIDAAAHRGGLAARASSIAVMGTGADLVYPRGNRALAQCLATDGCLVSEFPMRTPPLPGNFPQRNRVISGLSRGVLVVEAAFPSGSLNTARSALDQGREVFAVPGSIHSPLSKGCHWLLKEGAKLVESAEDVLAELGIESGGDAKESPGERVVERDPVLDEMGYGPASVDQLAQRTRLDAAKLAAHLSRLEIAGHVRALPGGWFQRVADRVIE